MPDHDPHGPPDWTSVQEGMSFFASAPGWAKGFADLGYGCDGDGVRGVHPSPGRQAPAILEHQRGTVLVRRFTHGGLLRGWTGEHFQNPERLLNEVRLTLQLADLGIPVAEPVSLRALCSGKRSWQLELGTRLLEGSRDLRGLLKDRVQGNLDDGPWNKLITCTALALRKAHEAGLDHVDLQPANLLVQTKQLLGQGPARVWIIDLDRCSLQPGSGEDAACRNLSRMVRWIERRYPGGGPVSICDRVRFLAAYEPNRDRRRALGQEVLARVQRGGPLHRLGRRLEGWLGLTREG